MNEVKLGNPDPGMPQILLRPLYRKSDPTRPAAYETCDFEPGAIIERCGKRYQLQKNGSQRRIA